MGTALGRMANAHTVMVLGPWRNPMKILALRTYSLSCNPILDPLVRLGHEVHELTFQHEDCTPLNHAEILKLAVENDLVVMLGQHDDGRGYVPSVEILAETASRVPFIHICCDGSEKVWWGQLERYKRAAPTMCHVNIDGVATGFFTDYGWTTLCPLDHSSFEPYSAPWDIRPIALGFCGGHAVETGFHVRGDDVLRLIEKKLVHVVNRPFLEYAEYQQFMGNCRAVYNHAATGTGDHMHVKARVLETAYAGAVLVEPEGSPTASYFVPDEDYLVYGSDFDLVTWKRVIEHKDSGFWRMADRFREKAIDLYSAERFWPKAFAMAGVG